MQHNTIQCNTNDSISIVLYFIVFGGITKISHVESEVSSLLVGPLISLDDMVPKLIVYHRPQLIDQNINCDHHMRTFLVKMLNYQAHIVRSNFIL